MNYTEQIKSPNWQRKRNEILNLRGYKCEQCGDTQTQLHVHHRFYIKGRMIHEYDNDVLQVLCEKCHSEVHNKKENIDFKKYMEYEDIIEHFKNYDKNSLETVVFALKILEENKKLFNEYSDFWFMIYDIFNNYDYNLIFNTYFDKKALSDLSENLDFLKYTLLKNNILTAEELNNIHF